MLNKLCLKQIAQNLLISSHIKTGQQLLMKQLFLILLFLSVSTFAQQTSVLENSIYSQVDDLVAHPSKETILKSSAFEKTISPKTKQEFLALVILNCNNAFYQNQFGLLQNAILSYEKAWNVYEKNKLSNYDIDEFCLKPLGNLYTLIGDFESAENTIKHYLYSATIQNNQLQKIAAIQNLSTVYISSGKNEEATQLLIKTISTESLSPIQKATLLNNLGSIYLISKKYSLSKNCLLESIKIVPKTKEQNEILTNAYRNIATILSLENNFEQSNLYFKKAKSLFFSNPNQEVRKVAKLYFEEATLFFNQQNYQESQKSLNLFYSKIVPNFNQKKGLPSQSSLFAEPLLLEGFDLQSALFLNQNQPKNALKSFELSFYVDELLQSLLFYENSKILNQISNRNRTEKCLKIYDYLYKTEKNELYLEKAFQLSERTKATVLKSSLKQSKLVSKTKKEILEALQNQNTIILKEQQKGNLANLEMINKAIKKQNELMLSIKTKYSEKEFNFDAKISVSKLFSKLNKDNSALVSYFFGNEKCYSFNFQNNKLTLHSFNNVVAIKNKITSFLNYFSSADKISNDVTGYSNTANQLYHYLKLPEDRKVKNLILIPDGLLNFVPFEALLVTKTNTTNFAKMHYLVSDFNIVYNSSVSFYLDNEQANKRNKAETILGVFPVFENSDFELTYSKNELQAIKNNFQGVFLEKNEATFSNFKLKSNTSSILHLSTHASSGDIETPASIKFIDQEVYYSELYNLNIKPNLVVLSACETGLGKLFKAEGAMSVSRGFQMAGAKNLLFSLWRVNDYTTSVFMEKFYKNIKNGFTYSQANRKAKLDFLKDDAVSNSKKSPYYWCAMVYYGDLQNENQINYLAIGAIIIGVLVFLFLLSKFIKQKSDN